MDTGKKVRELQENGFCVLRRQIPATLVEACRTAFEPVLSDYLAAHRAEPNRGPYRHFLPMPFESPCFAPEFFFDADILSVIRGVLDERIVADQWGCDVPLPGSAYQEAHVDYQRPLFAEAPDLVLPPYILVVSFGLARITSQDGPIEIAAGTHRMTRADAARAVRSGEVELRPIQLEVGDVLIRHPWAWHRGTPNLTDTPRALATIRYVRRWYIDNSREAGSIPRSVWEGLTEEQREMLRFPLSSPSATPNS